jgi:hypothetical protein
MGLLDGTMRQQSNQPGKDVVWEAAPSRLAITETNPMPLRSNRRMASRLRGFFSFRLYAIHPSSFAFALASCQARAKKWASWIGALSSPRIWNSFRPTRLSALQYLTMQFVPSNVTTTSSSAASTRKFRLVFILAPLLFALGVE